MAARGLSRFWEILCSPRDFNANSFLWSLNCSSSVVVSLPLFQLLLLCIGIQGNWICVPEIHLIGKVVISNTKHYQFYLLVKAVFSCQPEWYRKQTVIAFAA